jgi:hypothetical protein
MSDWADRAAVQFQLTHSKFCQGPDATIETEEKWRDALAATLRAAEKRGRQRRSAGVRKEKIKP